MSRNESEEREDFERWVLPEKYRTKGQPPPWFERHPNGDYINYAIRLQWDSWQARAALQSQDREDALTELLDSLDELLETQKQNAWTSKYKYSLGDRMDAGMRYQKARQAIDHARRVEGELK